MIFEYSCMYGNIKVSGNKTTRLISKVPFDKFRLAMITGISNGLSIIKEGDLSIGEYGDLEFEVSGDVMYMLDLFREVIGGLYLGLVTKEKMDDALFYRRVRAGH